MGLMLQLVHLKPNIFDTTRYRVAYIILVTINRLEEPCIQAVSRRLMVQLPYECGHEEEIHMYVTCIHAIGSLEASN